MYRLIIFIFILPLVACGQKAETKAASQEKPDLAAVYSQAIEDFIRAANEKNKSSFDTIFFGKRNNGQEDDFPEIKLPSQIAGATIQLIDPSVGEKMQKEIKTRIYINMFGWLEDNKAEFMFFVFSNGFEHQYNYKINYLFNATTNKYEQEKIVRKDPPFDK